MPSAMPVPATHYTTHRRSKTKLALAASVNSGKAVLAVGQVGIIGRLTFADRGHHLVATMVVVASCSTIGQATDERPLLLKQLQPTSGRRTISGEFDDEFGECSDCQGRGGLRELDGRWGRIVGPEDVSPRAAPQPDGEEPGFSGGGDVVVQSVTDVGDLVTAVT